MTLAKFNTFITDPIRDVRLTKDASVAARLLTYIKFEYGFICDSTEFIYCDIRYRTEGNRYQTECNRSSWKQN